METEEDAAEGPQLQAELPWLSDAYRLRLQQEVKDRQEDVQADRADSFVLCPRDHVDSYAELRLFPKSRSDRQGTRRPRSAAGGPRQLGRVRERIPDDVEWKGWAWAEGGGGDDGKENVEEGREDWMVEGAGEGDAVGVGEVSEKKGHALWLAAKRKHASSSSSSSRPSSSSAAAARNVYSPSPRSSSALGYYHHQQQRKANNSSLPPRPSSAMALRPKSSSSYSNSHRRRPAQNLHPEDSLPSRPSSAMSVHPNNNNDNDDDDHHHPASTRPASAMAFQPSYKPITKTATIPRPSSAVVYTRREITQRVSKLTQSQGRPSSASAATSSSAKPPAAGRQDPYTVREKRMRALHQAWTQDPRSGLHIGGAPGAAGPPPHLMDRHARCLNHHNHHQTRSWASPPQHDHLPERPHTACGLMRTGEGEEEGKEEEEEEGEDGGRGRGEDALEALLQEPHQQRDGMSRVQRYVDCHRPASASRMVRKELEGTFRRSVGTRGRSPHFCNFVHKAGLHARYDTAGHAHTGSGDDLDLERPDSLSSEATDGDVLAQWRKSRITTSGTEGRPGSPTSLDGRTRDRHVTSGLNDDDAMSAPSSWMGKPGRKPGRKPRKQNSRKGAKGNVSVIVNHLVNSEGESIRRPESMMTDDDNDNDNVNNDDKASRAGSTTSGKFKPKRRNSLSKSATGKSRAANMVIQRPNVPRAKLVTTINIPSSPIPTGDQMLSGRSSGESSPRKSAREEPKDDEELSEVKKTPKPQALPVSASPPPSREDKKDKGKRLPVSKKTRKGGDRRRKAKAAPMEQLPADASASAAEEKAASGDGEAQPGSQGADAKGVVPDLPEAGSAGKKNGKKGSRRGRRALIDSPPLPGEKLTLPQELLDLDSNSRTGYDFGDLESTLTDYNNKYKPQVWLSCRMALSQQASRFELPMDMKVLEKITPQDYLKRFCVVTSRRNNLYQKIFLRHKDKANTINKQGLETCLKETLVQQLKENTLTDLYNLLDITEDTVIDFKLYSGAAALTERILYPHYTTEDTLEKPEYQRERIETADFGSLDWKLHGIRIGEKMKRLLKTIE